MSNYQANITKTSHGFYTLVVRIDKDGETNVVGHYKGRHFDTLAAGEKSAAKYIAKHGLGCGPKTAMFPSNA